MKRVAHIVNSNIYSGLEKVVVTIMQNMNKEYDMIYVTQDGPIVKVLKEKKINYYIIEKMTPKQIRKFVKKWNPDIIHAHDFTASVICSLTFLKTPIISHIHNNALWIKKICLNSLAFLIAGLRVKKILTVSNSIKTEYIFSKILTKKMINVSNPVSISEVIEKIDNINCKKEFDICCVGRITEAKNPFKFIEIIKKIKEEKVDIKAIWIGTGELEKDVIAYAKQLKVYDNIKFVGYQSNPYPYVLKSKVFILTSKWEGFGLVAFEALALGLPCVVSNVGGLKDIVDNTCGYLCNSDEEYIQEIKKLLFNKEYYKVKSDSSIIKANKIDNLNEYMKEINQIYISII